METPHPILEKQEHQHLGEKVFWFFVLESSIMPGCLVIASIVILTITFNSTFSDTVIGGSIAEYGVRATLVTFLSAIIIEAVSIFVVWLHYIHYTFWISENAFRIKRGIFNKIEIAIPYRQIQNVDIERDLIYQIFGLSKLIILTAGHDENPGKYDQSEGIIPALDRKIAEVLHAELLKRAETQKVVTSHVQ